MWTSECILNCDPKDFDVFYLIELTAMDVKRLVPRLSHKRAIGELAKGLIEDHIFAFASLRDGLAVPLHSMHLCKTGANITEMLSRGPVFREEDNVISIR